MKSYALLLMEMKWSTISELYKFYSPLGIADRFFFLINLEGHVEMHERLFDVVACKRLCILFDGNKMANEKEPFFGFFQSLHLNNGV